MLQNEGPTKFAKYNKKRTNVPTKRCNKHKKLFLEGVKEMCGFNESTGHVKVPSIVISSINVWVY